MPVTPPTKCSEFGCKNPCEKGKSLCVDHAPSILISKERHDFNKKYKISAWDSIRQRQLSTMPLCQACLINKQVNQASHVDHVFPWRQIGEFAFRKNVFQSLCPECHGVKSGLEKKGIFRHYLKDDVRDYSVHDYQKVLYENATATDNWIHSQPVHLERTSV